MAKKIHIGADNYKKIIDNDYYYIDKTMLIADVEESGGEVALIPRPRRFGKSLNLSMLQYFYEKSDRSTAYLFEDKKIWQHEKYRSLQGAFPVITLNFKSIHDISWADAYRQLTTLLSHEYSRHQAIVPSLKPQEQEVYGRIITRTATETDYKNSLQQLTEYLSRFYSKPAIILIDEYDTPIHAGFLNGYYNEIIQFMRGFLGQALKGNSYLARAVITGILRTAREGLFSELNNLKVWGLLDTVGADKYGFTQDEIDQLLKDHHLSHLRDEFRSWYNGYQIGNVKVYNPWCAIECVDRGGRFDTYWANTSGNDLIKHYLTIANDAIKQDVQLLLEGKAVSPRYVTDRMALPAMKLGDETTFWSLLLYAGYLTVADACFQEHDRWMCPLTLPNREIKSLFRRLIEEIMLKSLSSTDLAELGRAFDRADGEIVAKILQKFIISHMSFHDTSLENEPESSYHMFVLGLLVTFANTYVLDSNRESGWGRYDIMLIPRDITKRGIVIEFKKRDEKQSMRQAAKLAMKQIKEQKYAERLRQAGVTKITGFGIACYKKELSLLQEEL